MKRLLLILYIFATTVNVYAIELPMEKIIYTSGSWATKDSHSIWFDNEEYVIVDNNTVGLMYPMQLVLYKGSNHIEIARFTFNHDGSGRKAWAPHLFFWGIDETTDKWLYIFFSDITDTWKYPYGSPTVEEWLAILSKAKISYFAYNLNNHEIAVFSSNSQEGPTGHEGDFEIRDRNTITPTMSGGTNIGLIDPAVFAYNDKIYLFAAKRTGITDATKKSRLVWTTRSFWGGHNVSYTRPRTLLGFWVDHDGAKNDTPFPVDEPVVEWLEARGNNLLNVVEAPVVTEINDNEHWLYWSVGPSDEAVCDSGQNTISAVRRGKLKGLGSYPYVLVHWNWGAFDTYTDFFDGKCHILTHPDIHPDPEKQHVLRATGWFGKRLKKLVIKESAENITPLW